VKIYYQYILKRVFNSFSAILFLLISLIWFSKTIAFVKYITENGIELKQFLLLFVLILPWLLMFIVPISLFAAILIVFNRLISNNEIAILKNAGLRDFAIARSTIKIGAYATAFCFIVAFFLMPYANKKMRLARINFENNYSNIGFSEGVFENLKSLTIYVRKKDDQGELFGILLHDERNPQYSMTITSKKGNLSFEEGVLLLYMKDGTAQRFDRETNKSEILTFDDYVFNLSDNDEGLENKMRWKPKERYLHELINPNDGSTPSDIAKYRAEIQQRITYPLMSLVMTLIAVSVMLNGNFSRRGNMSNILFASILAITFLVTTIILYRIIEAKFHFVVLLYLNYIFFILLSLKLLIAKRK
jgi:lipopolysaccharide export system permease protein